MISNEFLGKSPPSTSKHLHHLQICILLQTVVCVGYCILNNDKMARQVDTNGKSGCATDDTDLHVEKPFLDGSSVACVKPSMVKSYASRYGTCASVSTMTQGIPNLMDDKV